MQLLHKHWLNLALAALLPAFVVAFSTPLSSAMYPRVLDASSLPESDEAVVLVGNAGPGTINYLQFTHSSMPAINARNITLPPGGVVAVPVPVGTKGLSLSVYTMLGRTAGYFANGMSIGYTIVRTPTIDISKQGLYYIATVHTDRPTNQNYNVKPNGNLLAKFRAARPKLAGSLRPINFTWSR